MEHDKKKSKAHNICVLDFNLCQVTKILKTDISQNKETRLS